MNLSPLQLSVIAGAVGGLVVLAVEYGGKWIVAKIKRRRPLSIQEKKLLLCLHDGATTVYIDGTDYRTSTCCCDGIKFEGIKYVEAFYSLRRDGFVEPILPGHRPQRYGMSAKGIQTAEQIKAQSINAPVTVSGFRD